MRNLLGAICLIFLFTGISNAEEKECIFTKSVNVKFEKSGKEKIKPIVMWVNKKRYNGESFVVSDLSNYFFNLASNHDGYYLVDIKNNTITKVIGKCD